MSYIDAYKPKDKDQIHVIERVNGERKFRQYQANYVLYYEDPNGTYNSMWGVPCKKVVKTSQKEFNRIKYSMHDKKTHESDINPVFRCLEENYLNKEAPALNIAFFDIETDFDPNRGFADPWDPFSRITAITTYQKWTGKLITFVLKPDVPETEDYFLSFEEAEKITNKFDDCYLCDTEKQLLECFLESIEDADVISGWNSTGYDIPYVINRIKRELGKEYMKKMCAFDVMPRVRTYTKFKKEFQTYDLSGRVHLDYLELYQKHSQAELASYRLDYVGEVEVKEKKVQYEGTLDSLYKKDFEKFIAYNRQDTLLLNKIDDKKRFIELANQIAHTNTVLLQTTMGSVALIEQSIINEAHRRGMVVPNKKYSRDYGEFLEEEDELLEDVEFDMNSGPAVGAYVADPKIGIHDQIGCCDINSLYPSVIRALNLGPETLVGQIRNDRTAAIIKERIDEGVKGPDAWHGIFCLKEFDLIHEQTDDILVIDFEDGSSQELTAKQVYDLIFNEDSNLVVTANGTIFTKSVEGTIPGLLEKWYAERKVMRGHAASYNVLASEGLELPEDVLKELI